MYIIYVCVYVNILYICNTSLTISFYIVNSL